MSITLSAGVRQNLLSLQNTADMMATTQNRLATGKKVNSALDNPTSFFTASSLQTRSNDLSQLMDSMSNGIKTLEAADNGLSAITKSLESMRSTLTQARQDKSFETKSYTMDMGDTLTGTETMSFSGGSIGDTAVEVALSGNTGGTATAAISAAVTGTESFGSAAAVTGATSFALEGGKVTTSSVDHAGGVDAATGGADIVFTVEVDDGSAVTVTLENDDATASGGTGIFTADDITDKINAALTADSQTVTATASIDEDGNLSITSDSKGKDSNVTVGGADETTLGFTADQTDDGQDAGVDASSADIVFDIAVDDGDAVTVTLDDEGGTSGIYSAEDIQEAINDALDAADQEGTVTAAFDSTTGGLKITSDTLGSTGNITVSDGSSPGDASDIGFTDADAASTATGVDPVVDASSTAITFDIAVDGGDAVTVTLATDGGADEDGEYDADDITTAINAALTAAGQTATVAASFAADGGLVITSDAEGTDGTITVSDGDAGDASVLGFADGADAASGTGTAAGYDGGTNSAKTVDEMVALINNNTDLKGKVRASNDDGKLRIENQSTQEMTVTGATTSGGIDGGTATQTIDGNSVRADLSTQYNELRDQLDKLSDDASYNGINLLRGDNLKLTFNETGTSTIDIQTKNAKTINAATLSISDIEAKDLDSDDDIDTLINSVKSALDTVRSQSSAFGSNLSIVENRQGFTTSMMNTLQTGADGLTLADGNLEAANMLALQTRQQLSSTALSLASQADQAPLRLF